MGAPFDTGLVRSFLPVAVMVRTLRQEYRQELVFTHEGVNG